MFLTDRAIKKLNSSIIISGYNESNVNDIFYDITIDNIICNGDHDFFCY